MEDSRNSRQSGVTRGSGTRKVAQGNRTQGSRQNRVVENGERKQAASTVGRPPQGKKHPSQTGRPPQGKKRPIQKGRPPQGGKRPVNKEKAPLTPQQVQKKKRNKILLFVAEIFVLLMLLVVFWGVNQVRKINIVAIDEEEVEINEEIQEYAETGVMKGYRNIAIFGVDSREKQLDKATRTDVIMIASINQDTGDVKLVSLYRDTFLNLSTDTYNKANLAYSKGGPKQAIAMLNMNLDLNITDFVTIGFEGVINAIDSIGGIEINVTQAEIIHLNNFQISMVGKQDGLNAAGEPNYVATPGVDYTPVTQPGLQKLNGLQATAYMRIRQVGNDFGRTQRQRTVIEKVAKKALTMNPSTLSGIAESVFPQVATSLELSEILELLGDIAKYSFGETSGFPFDGEFWTGMLGKKGSCIVPTTLEENVILLHQFFFGATEADYQPSETVKTCSQKIQSETAAYTK